ncbi:MAG: hypothetical protein IJI14_00855 [Anaerolineaceae bacterium]|nr:hypothetical protein [Anaerolineaceae bacterium]
MYSNEPDGMQDILMNDNGVLAVQSGTQHLMFSKVLPHVPGSAAIKENPSLNEFSGKWKMVSYLETGVFNGKEISFQVDAPIKDALEIREKHLDMSIYGYMYYNLPFVLDSGKLVTLIGDTESESDFIGILIELHTDGYLVAKVMPDENTQLQMVFAKEK